MLDLFFLIFSLTKRKHLIYIYKSIIDSYYIIIMTNWRDQCLLMHFNSVQQMPQPSAEG